MADDIDRGLERDEILMQAMAAHRKPVPVHTGRCLNCEEPIGSGVYCDSDCRDDHEKEVVLGAQRPR